jgi:hypothetical protein
MTGLSLPSALVEIRRWDAGTVCRRGRMTSCGAPAIQAYAAHREGALMAKKKDKKKDKKKKKK